MDWPRWASVKQGQGKPWCRTSPAELGWILNCRWCIQSRLPSEPTVEAKPPDQRRKRLHPREMVGRWRSADQLRGSTVRYAPRTSVRVRPANEALWQSTIREWDHLIGQRGNMERSNGSPFTDMWWEKMMATNIRKSSENRSKMKNGNRNKESLL
jgi:hypothetical protein